MKPAPPSSAVASSSDRWRAAAASDEQLRILRLRDPSSGDPSSGSSLSPTAPWCWLYASEYVPRGTPSRDDGGSRQALKSADEGLAPPAPRSWSSARGDSRKDPFSHWTVISMAAQSAREGLLLSDFRQASLYDSWASCSRLSHVA